MFKKICLFLLCFMLFGCNKTKSNDLINTIQKSLKKVNSYNLKGNLELYSDEETFKYKIDVSHSNENFYLVSLINEANEKEQIILKNDDGLYVITPSLNKSFKFDSNWPNNSSQVYILESLLNDIKKDNACTTNEKDKYIQCKVNYPNNPDLTYENIYLDDDNNISKIEVFNSEDTLKIKLVITNYDLNKKINENIYNISNYMTTDKCSDESCNSKTTMSSIEDAIYPLYMPTNTYLNNSEIVSSDDNSRAILTFSGESNFVIVEQPASVNEEMEIIPVYGNPVLINDTIAALSSNSVYWTSENIDYYLATQDMTQEQIISVVSSLGTTRSTIATTK